MTAPTPQEEEPRRRRLLLWLGAVTVLLLLAGGATALVTDGEAAPTQAARPTPAPSSPVVVVDDPQPASGGALAGKATGTGVVAASLGLDVAARVVGAVAPGSDASLIVFVTNPLGSEVVVTSVTGGVTSTTAAGCRLEWYRVGSFSGSQRVAPGSSTSLTVPVRFLTSPTVNQDACQGASYAFSVDVRARQS